MCLSFSFFFFISQQFCKIKFKEKRVKFCSSLQVCLICHLLVTRSLFISVAFPKGKGPPHPGTDGGSTVRSRSPPLTQECVESGEQKGRMVSVDLRKRGNSREDGWRGGGRGVDGGGGNQ